MTLLVFTRPAAAIPFGVLVALWALTEWAQAARSALAGRRGGERDAGSRAWIQAGVLGGFVGGFLLAAPGILPLPAPAVCVGVGLALAWAGLLLRLWAEATLGRYFTITVRVSADQPVITAGPYRLVRHPSYLGLLTMLLGIGIALGSLASALVLVALPAVGIARRIAVEEEALRTTLGAPYVEYCAGRARMIPGVW